MGAHLLDDAQKNHRRASAIELLELLRRREAHDFNGITIGEESWFHYDYEPREKFPASREKGYLLLGLSRGFKNHGHSFPYIYDANCK
jgi:hypothetical protein